MTSTSPPLSKRVLLGEQTASTLLANVVHVYRHHFGVIVGCVVLPFALPVILIAPGLLLGIVKPGEPQPAFEVALLVGFGLFYVALFLVQGALTVVLSDICLGNVPKLNRAFGRVVRRRRWWYLFTTSLLVGLAAMLGLILLIVGSLWVIVRSIFAVTVVVLEGSRNRDAIRRSFALTKGQAWRVLGFWFLILLLAQLAGMILGAGMAGIALVMAVPEFIFVVTLLGMQLTLSLLALPLGQMVVVLLYYDQRVRRESYDAQALSEDLMR